MNYGDIAIQLGVLLFALSFHEMAHAWVDVTYLEQDDFEAQVAAREASSHRD